MPNNTYWLNVFGHCLILIMTAPTFYYMVLYKDSLSVKDPYNLNLKKILEDMNQPNNTKQDKMKAFMKKQTFEMDLLGNNEEINQIDDSG